MYLCLTKSSVNTRYFSSFRLHWLYHFHPLLILRVFYFQSFYYLDHWHSCIDYIIDNKGILHDLSSLLSLPTITLEIVLYFVLSVGSAKVTISLLLLFVFYIPSFPFNLLSINIYAIHELFNDATWFVHFQDNRSSSKSQESIKIVHSRILIPVLST